MAQIQLTPGAMAVAGVAVLGLGYLAWKTRGMNATDIASGAVSGAISAAGNAATGTVLGIGDAVGIPRTSESQCSADLAAGRLWDASFSCPAGRFLGEGVFGWGEDESPAYKNAMNTAAQQPATWGREARTTQSRDNETSGFTIDWWGFAP